MNASRVALDELNLLVEEASLLAVVNKEKLLSYLAETSDSPAIRERRIAHVMKLEEQYEGLVAFRQRFHQSMLEAIAEIYHVLSKDKMLKGAKLIVEYTDDKFSPTYPFQINLYFI
ncbi:hypothetical protein H8S95_03590 [Pontibacter sp. KCTC 32443]|uniref:hypothetical protein n=1 Tax=Pontibacter TaxID=323449 RepID=UPI00164E18F8|nr:MULTISPECIES: hypothetical protein [Pontibacter]MBC5773135.1 hypothetical protein [Pontibacter sp. KCTC 32443]